MSNEYYGVASTPTEDFLAHYGVKGMKWGVRKARAQGLMSKRGQKTLSRQYNKAAKKLAKLEKRAASGKKYAKRAAALGVGAAASGALAYQGTRGVSRLIGKTGGVIRRAGPGVGNAMRGAGAAIERASYRLPVGANVRSKVKAAGQNLSKAGRTFRDSGAANAATALGNAGSKVATWGNSNSISKGAAGLYGKAAGKMAGGNAYAQKAASDMARGKATKALGGVSNNTIVRAGMAAVGAGLGAGAAYNAYRAATTKRAAKKAAQFRSEMNKAFAGTAYANGRPASQKKKKRR